MKLSKLVTASVTASIIFLGGCATHPHLPNPETIPLKIDRDIRETDKAKEASVRREFPQASRSRQIVKIQRGNDWLREPIDEISFDGDLEYMLNEVLGGRPKRIQLLEDLVQQGQAFTPQPVDLPNGEQYTGAAGQVDRVKELLRTRVTAPINAPTVKQQLDSLMAQTGLVYTIDSGVVVISDYELKTFQIGSNSIADRPSFVFTESPTSNTPNQQQNSTGVQDVASQLEELLPEPTKVMHSTLTNTITVAAKRTEMDRAEKIISAINSNSAKRVVLKVEIYDIDLTALGERSIDFALSNLASEISGLEGVTTSINALTGSAQQEGSGVIRFGIDRPGDSIDGANGFIRYLRSTGSITSRASREFVMSNNESQMNVSTTEQVYVSEIASAINTGFGGQTNQPTLRTDTANTGTAIQVSQTVSNGRIFVNLMLEESQLVALTPIQIGDEDNGQVSSFLPTTKRQSSTHSFVLFDGESVAIGASQITRRGLEIKNDKFVPIIGDDVTKNESRVQTLVVVTGHIVG